jgi:hypothetical protein
MGGKKGWMSAFRLGLRAFRLGLGGFRLGPGAIDLMISAFHLKDRGGVLRIPWGNEEDASPVPQMLVVDKQLIAIFLRRRDRPVSVNVVYGFGKRGEGPG